MLCAVFALSAPSHAEDTGHALAMRVFERPDGNDAVTRGRMTLRGAGARERVRDLFEYRTGGGAESRVLIRFTSPANIADTGLLVHNHEAGESDQWLYLPAAQRVRRVSSSNRGGSFVQSDLFFEDLEDRHPDKDQHRILGEEDFEGVTVTRMESVPVEASNSVYSRRESWIHEETLLPLRIDFFQGGDEPAKRLEVQRIEEVQGYWTVMQSTVTTLRTGHQTLIEIDAIVYDQGIDDELFSTRALADPRLEHAYRP